MIPEIMLKYFKPLTAVALLFFLFFPLIVVAQPLAVEPVKVYFQQPIYPNKLNSHQKLNQRVFGINRFPAIAAAAAQQEKRQEGKIVIPSDFFPAVVADRPAFQGRIAAPQSIQHHPQKTAQANPQ